MSLIMVFPESVQEYRQVRIGEDLFSVGDTVLLRNPDADGLPFAARIVRMFEAGKGK